MNSASQSFGSPITHQKRILACFLLSLVSISAETLEGSIQAKANCDSSLIVTDNPRNPDLYRDRGDRCEGIYRPALGGEVGLNVVSLTYGPLDFDPRLDSLISISRPASHKEELFIRARGIEPEMFYQLDASLSDNEQFFRWPADILRRQTFDSGMLGVVVWYFTRIGQVIESVLLPTRVNGSSLDQLNDSIQIILLPESDMKDLRVQIFPISSSGKLDKKSIFDHNYGSIVLAGGWCIKFSLAPNLLSGICKGIATGKYLNGNPIRLDFYFEVLPSK